MLFCLYIAVTKVKTHPTNLNQQHIDLLKNSSMWIDSHCHLDAHEFDTDRDQVIAQARSVHVTQMVIPAVATAHFPQVIQLAHLHNCTYALGIHPLWIHDAQNGDITNDDKQYIRLLHDTLTAHHADSRLVAIGEIGLDYFVPNLSAERQWFYYAEQLKLAQKFQLPVILHVRKSADMLLKGLRQYPVCCGIAHAFNGSDQQAHMFLALGFKLGFGGACTFERARQIRHLAQSLPLEAIVLETDAPDMPPQWLYKTAEERLQGATPGRNTPSQLPQIAQTIAQLRNIPLDQLMQAAHTNTLNALPKLNHL